MDNFTIIPENERNLELEEKVKYYVNLTPNLPVNDKLVRRASTPDGATPYELEIWQREELRRIKEGHFGMSPKMYFWFNYAKMWDVESDVLIRPDYMVCQQEWFKAIEKAQASKEFGVIAVKRRRVGASWMEAADVLHDCITRPLFKAGMTSKTKEDAVELFKKVKFIYDNLPDWMRPTSTAGNTITSIDFAYKYRDQTGSKKVGGLQSSILVKAPNETSWEGYALKKWVADESGKISGLKSLFSMSNAVMLKGFRRVGTPLLFGTAGDITKEGKEFKQLWYDADIHKLTRFFFGGWMGVPGLVDSRGNDMKEDAIRCIVYERKRRESLSTKEYNDFLQQFPLTVQEAFITSDAKGLGNPIKIQNQIRSLDENPVMEKRGEFQLGFSGDVRFVPNPRGKCIIYEEPKPNITQLYCGGCDPVDHIVEDTKDASSLSMFIVRKQDGLSPPKIVFQYTDRPNDPRDFYDQAVLALRYYNNCLILIERNRTGMITHFEDRGYKYLLKTAPNSLNRLWATTTSTIGVYMNKNTRAYMEELINGYLEDYCEHIPCRELLGEFGDYGLKNTDRVYGFGMALIYLKEDRSTAKDSSNSKFILPSYRNQGGRLVRFRPEESKIA